MKHLLGKSSEHPDKPHGAESLVGHTLLVVEAAKQLLKDVGLASLDATGLPRTALERLRRIVLTAAFVHDLGKCSESFQRMVRGENIAQLFRHEAVSLWLCWPRPFSPLAPWLLSAVDASPGDLKIALAAAAGHHRKFTSGAIRDEGGSELRLLTSHRDFSKLLATGAALLGLGPAPELPDLQMSGLSSSSDRAELTLHFPISFEDEDFSVDDERLLALVKALLIDADVAGSALPKTEAGMRWLPRALSLEPTDSLKKLVERRLAGRALRPFQEIVAASTAPVTLVRAGCGSGKTLAAWLWGARQHAHRQFWLCYPTTGTTTEGFRDYVQGADLHAFIEHGRSKVDVSFFRLQEGLGDEDVVRDAERLRALRQWGADAITCTVDTVLGLLQNQRKGLYAWPGLCRSAVVFDEIHAYDDALFGLLLAWLQGLPGIPVLLMTASLPANRLAALRSVVERVHKRSLVEVDGPPELETLGRYYRSPDAADDIAQRVLSQGGKVLWVSNTVKRCMAVRQRGPWAANARLYHSRFRYCDRVARHRDVVDAFSGEGGQLAATTQVAEMSLDLSADLLVTELAPIPSLIQRLGRLNRRSTPEWPAAPCPFVVLETPRAEPYEQVELEEARAWLTRLGAATVSQSDLVTAWSQPSGTPSAPAVCSWFGGGYRTEPREVREGSPGVVVLLEGDATRVERGVETAVRVALPLGPPPRSVNLSKLRRVAYHPVVPANVVSYDEEEGAQWL